MIRILLKKQLAEIFRSYFYNPKKNKARSKAVTAVFFVGFVLIMVGLLGGMFGFLAYQLCGPFYMAGVGWLYFTILGMLAIVFGTFGSVFNTFSGLYLGKDNDLLLSMPVPVRAILVSRLMGVYLMGLMYSAVICIPALVVWWITAGFTLGGLAAGLLWFLDISVLVLILSCVLGWAVARLSLRLKNKSYVTVLLSIVFIGLYYFVYFKAQSLLRKLIENAALYGERIKGSARLIYGFGRAGAGSWPELLIMTAILGGLLVLTWVVLSRSFLKIATATGNVSHVKYREKAVRQGSPDAALLRKELSRFTSSANYMLNCGLGLLFLPAMGIFLLIRGRQTLSALYELFGSGSVAVGFCAIAYVMGTMIDPAAPSVSLEGRALWQLQCLPVTPWQALRAKLRLNLLLAAPPTLFCVFCMLPFHRGDLLQKLLILGNGGVGVLLNALVGLTMSVRLPNLTWTNEAVPMKQSAAVFITLFGGMIYGFAPAVVYFILQPDANLWLGLMLLASALLSAGLYAWLRTRGAARFAAL